MITSPTSLADRLGDRAEVLDLVATACRRACGRGCGSSTPPSSTIRRASARVLLGRVRDRRALVAVGDRAGDRAGDDDGVLEAQGGRSVREVGRSTSHSDGSRGGASIRGRQDQRTLAPAADLAGGRHPARLVVPEAELREPAGGRASPARRRPCPSSDAAPSGVSAQLWKLPAAIAVNAPCGGRVWPAPPSPQQTAAPATVMRARVQAAGRDRGVGARPAGSAGSSRCSPSTARGRPRSARRCADRRRPPARSSRPAASSGRRARRPSTRPARRPAARRCGRRRR